MSLSLAALVACTGGGESHVTFSENGAVLELPRTWSITGFSEDPTPPRLVAASYAVRPSDVLGDCGGQSAVSRLPADGAYVVLVDYGPHSATTVDQDDLRGPLAGRDRPFDRVRFGEFGCFGPSYAFLFVVDGRALQAHVGLGPEASSETRKDALHVLRSIAVEPG